MDKIPISIAVICKNEAHNIERLLQSVIDFAEVIIVDSGSTDATLDIAKKYTDKIYSHDWAGDGPQRQRAIAYCQYDWVLNLDADEQLTPALVNEIKQAIQSNQYDAYKVKFNDYFMGRFDHQWSRMHAKVRFFRKSRALFLQKEVHASAPDIQGNVGLLKNPIMHYGDVTIENKIYKNNLYSSLAAKDKIQRGKRASVIKLLLIFPLVFIKSYVFKRAFLDGWRGFVNSMISAFYAFLKEAKLYEQNLK
ncbi:MAG: glycosyltransferase family 2 protein [Agitococcus sp.]